jgi:hypothetical protein
LWKKVPVLAHGRVEPLHLLGSWSLAPGFFWRRLWSPNIPRQQWPDGPWGLNWRELLGWITIVQYKVVPQFVS